MGSALRLADFGGDVAAVSAGYFRACALLAPANGSVVKCAGFNDDATGALGFGVSTTSWGRYSTEIGDALPRVLLATGVTASPTIDIWVATKSPTAAPTNATKSPTAAPTNATKSPGSGARVAEARRGLVVGVVGVVGVVLAGCVGW